MAAIERFTARAPRKGNLEPSTDNGAADALASVAKASAQLAGRLGQAADKQAIREGEEAGAAAALQVDMPGVDFAFDASSATTTPGQIGGPVSAIIDAAARKHGVDPAALARIAWIESKGNPKAKNPASSAGGLFQFVDSTAAQYGLADRFDPVQAADAAARLARDNAGHLRKVLGRDPTAGELYLAHQQGAGGAAKLLRNPGARAVDVVGADAVRLNGGNADMTAGDFANLWISKAGGGRAVAAAPANTGSTIDFARAGAVDPITTAATDAPPTAGGIRVSLTGGVGAVPKMQAGTLRGDAFNRAAIDIHTNRLDTAMRGQMDAIALEHDGDPAGLSGALEALRAGYVADLPPQSAALVDQSFSAHKMALERGAITTWKNNQESANIAAFEENIAARTSSVFRIAAKAGLDAAADAALNSELGALTAQIDASPMTPLQKSRARAEAVQGVTSARVLGGFEAQKDPAARAAYAKQFQEDWRSGEGSAAGLDHATYDKINGELIRRTQADAVEANKRSATLEKAIDGQLDFLKKGWPVSEANRALLKAEVAKTGNADLAKNLDFLDGLADWQKAHIAVRPQVVDAQIAAMRARIQKEGASEAALTTLDVMEGLRDEMTKGLAEDPLTFASRAGVASVEPLNFTDGTTLSASLSERVADAAAVATHYGIEPKFFTPAEADGLKKMLKATPLALPSIVSALSAGLGTVTPKALAEISKDAPLLAHVAGLVHATGSQRVAVEIGEALDLRNQQGYKSTLPTPAKLQGAAAEDLGASLSVLPGTAAGTMETASALFEARALARGIAVDEFDTAGSPARVLYQEALDDVLGATRRDGVKYGGVTEVNGRETIAPPDIAAHSLEDMLAELSSDDLLFQRGIGSANGVPIRIEDLRGGQLVMTGQGRYRIALGDIEGGDPRFVPDAAGGYFELDVSMLKKSQARRMGDNAQQRRRQVIRAYGEQFAQ